MIPRDGIERFLVVAADFVEYCYGAAESTTWGSVRKNDGHAEPYKKFW